VGAAVRARPGTFAGIAAAMAVLSIVLPPLVLSVVRKPADFFMVNPWLRRLPGYLADPAVAWSTKLAKLRELALFWFSADSPHGGTEWGFAVDVGDLARILLTAVLFGLYFALWLHRRDGSSPRDGRSPRRGARLGRQGGVLGALVSVLGLSTGPCSVMGCGAPVLPVVGLAFAGLSSGTLRFLADLSAVGTGLVLGLLAASVVWLAWQGGREETRRS
jgi:hypothetical protein